MGLGCGERGLGYRVGGLGLGDEGSMSHRAFRKPLSREEGSTQKKMTSTCKSRPESILDCLVCATFARRRSLAPRLTEPGCVSYKKMNPEAAYLRLFPGSCFPGRHVNFR